MRCRKPSGFTLVEILVVIGIIALLAAILFPVFSSVKEKARQSTCLSNLRQAGIAISMYAQDSDDHYPAGVDGPQHYVYLWHPDDDTLIQIKQLPLLRDVLYPYSKSNGIWQCPSDTTTERITVTDTEGQGLINLPASSAYDLFGTSYGYRLSLAFAQTPYPATGHTLRTPSTAVSSSEVGIMADMSSNWHSGSKENLDSLRQNILYADNHAKSGTGVDFIKAWLIPAEGE